MSRKNVLIAIVVVLIGAGRRRREPAISRRTKGSPSPPTSSRRAISRRSSRRPARFSRSASSRSAPRPPGKVVNLAVNEGDRVKIGQFSLQIDPSRCSARVDGGTASLQAAQALDRAAAAVGRDRARRSSMQAQQNLDAPAGSVEAAADDARGAREGRRTTSRSPSRTCQEREKNITPQESRINVEKRDASRARATT